MKKIEALCDAFVALNNAFDPSSDAYQLKNPLLIKSFGRAGKHEIDRYGRRVFSSFVNGYKAGLYDLELKVSGQSRAKLKVSDGLENLVAVYGRPRTDAEFLVSFLRQALDDPELPDRINLEFFVEK